MRPVVVLSVIAGATGEDGSYPARGFYGDYLATVEFQGRRAGQPFALRPGEPSPIVELKLP